MTQTDRSDDPQSWAALDGAPQELSSSAPPPRPSGELILAADTTGMLQGDWKDGEGMKRQFRTAIFRASETGVVDLSRLQMSVLTNEHLSANIYDRNQDAVAYVTIEAIIILGAQRLVLGRRQVSAPAGVFDPLRRQIGIQLGRVELASNDTISVTLSYRKCWESPPLISMAVPFRPKQRRERFEAGLPANTLECVVAASGVTIEPKPADDGSVSKDMEPHLKAIGKLLNKEDNKESENDAKNAFGDVFVKLVPGIESALVQMSQSLHLRFAFEEDGVVDLDSLQLEGSLWWAGTRQPWDLIPRVLVQGIRLPGGQDLVVGNEGLNREFHSPSIPASVFSSRGRFRNWFHFGHLAVRRGQQISVTLRSARGEILTSGLRRELMSAGFSTASEEKVRMSFSAALRFYRSSSSYQELVQPSTFFDRRSTSIEAWHSLPAS